MADQATSTDAQAPASPPPDAPTAETPATAQIAATGDAPAGTDAPASTDAPAGTEPADEPRTPGFGERGRMRRRLRFLRKARELAYRDLGGLIFEMHRLGERHDELAAAKLATLSAIDSELRALEQALADRQPVTVLREAGIAACPRCAAIHGSEDRFCPACGTPMDRRADRPIAAAGTPATNAVQSPAAPTAPPAPTPAATAAPASPAQPTAAAPLGATPAAPGTPTPAAQSTRSAQPMPTPAAQPTSSPATEPKPTPAAAQPTSSPAAQPTPALPAQPTPAAPLAPASKPAPASPATPGGDRASKSPAATKPTDDRPTEIIRPPDADAGDGA